ncbi:hypothetical protein CC78DRAFT_581062 [Lojkania enalia]|uniref:Uncharacterized protein n=1 Tax=Lojkania enalia TaxID=147567 RepID=A0A9P4K8A6_9PLEO|nr:hypothetical protein CC78DRAFT_581062 [Didymosphaeria enalia]
MSRIIAIVSLISLLSHLSLGAPTIAAGSKKNFYLVSCRDYEGTYDAIAYYPNGPPKTANEWPSEIGEVSRPSEKWEGVEREADIFDDDWFIVRINEGAASMKKGEIAGTGSFEGEPFVCFKSEGVLFTKRLVVCEARYWCPSIDVGGENTV